MPFVIAEEIIVEASRRLAEAVSPGARVLLFGSHARGDAGPDSDLDFLVIDPDVKSEFREMIRLRRSLRGLAVPADVIVVTPEAFEERRRVRGDFLHAVAREARVLHEPS